MAVNEHDGFARSTLWLAGSNSDALFPPTPLPAAGAHVTTGQVWTAMFFTLHRQSGSEWHACQR